MRKNGIEDVRNETRERGSEIREEEEEEGGAN